MRNAGKRRKSSDFKKHIAQNCAELTRIMGFVYTGMRAALHTMCQNCVIVRYVNDLEQYKFINC
jgi:hypothetical protein